MNNSMISALVSMSGLQQKLDVLSDNMANASTIGYKSKKVSFEDVLTKTLSQESGMKKDGRATPLGFTLSWGTRLSHLSEDLTQGNVQTTNVPTDLALEGNALFEIKTDDQGGLAWTRDGSFQLGVLSNDTSYMTLMNSQGQPVMNTQNGPIQIPIGYQMQIDATGAVTAVSSDGSEVLPIGYIKVVQPTQPDLLTKTDHNMYILPAGTAQTALNDFVTNVDLTLPNRTVSVRQGALEQSNVNLADEMVDLMQVQRAYQLTARALTSSDTMMGLANNLRG